MTRIVVLVCAMAALVATQAQASDQDLHAKSPKAEFSISTELVVGTAALKPGIYTFQCVTIGGTDFLVVKNDDGKEVARVPCRPEDLAAKNGSSDYRYARNSAGVAELTSVRIRGEKIAHKVVTN
jgi:hypothetical protein